MDIYSTPLLLPQLNYPFWPILPDLLTPKQKRLVLICSNSKASLKVPLNVLNNPRTPTIHEQHQAKLPNIYSKLPAKNQTLIKQNKDKSEKKNMSHCLSRACKIVHVLLNLIKGSFRLVLS